MARIKVIVSPFYGGEEWLDEATNITFKQNRTGYAEIYTVPEGKDLSGIRKAINLNALVLVEGTLSDLAKVEAPKVETPKVEVKEPEVKVEVQVSEEVVVEKPATKSKQRPAKAKK